MNTVKVKVTKVESLPNRPVGDGSGGPIVEGYYVIGEQVNPPTIGESYTVHRFERNGVRQYGVFQTSEVDIFDRIDEKTI